ncbi:dihydropteroate synthase [Kiritimatiellota bacterium B12222]|nr:dihydropteroate synthase [Kiritimatiellota bacterium B12222]
MQWKTGVRKNDAGQRPLVMGIVNVTPDSFSDGGAFLDSSLAIAHGCQLAAEGADILDIGGESTRPGARAVTAEEEQERVVPVIAGLRKALPEMLISIDSSKASVAEAAVEVGADIINDVSAGLGDPGMLPLAARTGVGLVLMHMQGTPSSMQTQPHYDDVLAEVGAFLSERVEAALAAGVVPEQLCLDPGIGFGKTLEHNLTLIAGLSRLKGLGYPLLLGVSRKRWLGELTGREVDNRLAASLAGAASCIFHGANILRVHDVIESCDLVRILDRVEKTSQQLSL